MMKFPEKSGRLAIAAGAVCDTAGSQGMAVARCKNLRPERGPEGRTVLSCIRRPKLLTAAQMDVVGALPLPSDPSKEVLILLREPRVACLMPGEKEPRDIGQIGGQYYCSAVSGNRLILSHSAGMDYVEFDGDTPYLRPMPVAEDYHGIALRAVHHTVVQATSASRKLSRDYNVAELSLDAPDIQRLGADISDTYLRLCSSARAMGGFVQPLLARYRVYDAMMNELYTSAPLLLSHPEGVQCTDSVRLLSLDRRQVESFSLSAQSWRIRLDLPAGLPGDAAFVAVSVTPQFHPYDPDATATVGLSRQQSMPNEFGRLTLPGAGAALGSANIGGARALILQSIARMDELEQTVATFDLRSHVSRSISIECGAPTEVKTELRKLATVLSHSIYTSDPHLQRLASPHRFCARRACAGPSALLWGGLRSRRYGGYPLTQFAATSVDRAWRGWIKVNFTDGSAAVWSGGGQSGAPLTIGPMLSYPSADAVNMVIGLQIDGEDACEMSLPLSADPSASRSVYIRQTLLPFGLPSTEDGATLAPTPKDSPTDYSDILAIAPVAAPQAISAVYTPGKGEIRAIAAAGGSQSAWDFGRARFYVFCDGGILSVNSNSSLNRLAATPVDPRVCTGPEAVTTTDGSVRAVVSGDLIRLQANKAHTERSGCDYTAIAWSRTRRELIGQRTDGTLELTATDFGNSRFEADLSLGGGKLYSPHGGLIAVSAPGGIYNLAEESKGEKLDVEWAVDFSRRDMTAIDLLAIAADIASEEFNGILSLRRRSGSHVAPAPDAGFIIRGPLKSPVGARLLGRPARQWRVILAGNCSDLSIGEIVLRYTLAE